MSSFSVYFSEGDQRTNIIKNLKTRKVNGISYINHIMFEYLIDFDITSRLWPNKKIR